MILQCEIKNSKMYLAAFQAFMYFKVTPTLLLMNNLQVNKMLFSYGQAVPTSITPASLPDLSEPPLADTADTAQLYITIMKGQ